MVIRLTHAFKNLFVHRTPALPLVALADGFVVPQQGQLTLHALHFTRQLLEGIEGLIRSQAHVPIQRGVHR